jgi:hypothetical protein
MKLLEGVIFLGASLAALVGCAMVYVIVFNKAQKDRRILK